MGETRDEQRAREDRDQRGAADLEAEGRIFTGSEEPDDAAPRQADSTDHPAGQSFTPPREADIGDEKAQTKAQRDTASARAHDSQVATNERVARRRSK